MRPVDSRRLTGPHLLLPGVVGAGVSGAAVEVVLDPGETSEMCIDTWVARVRVLYAALGWDRLQGPLVVGARVWDERDPAAPLAPGQFVGAGLSLAFASPPDRLLAACLVAEQAVVGVTDLDAIHLEAAVEVNPALRALVAGAQARGVRHFHDDDGFTAGQGTATRSWPLDALPDRSALDAVDVGVRIPTVLVTGTNGKTTTSRLLARMARESGRVDGLTSSDAISVGGTVVKRGDWSGPGAARTLLRDTSVGFAVLETARGGLLRRGLAIADADVAVVTNVSDDHFGDYGIDTLAGMAAAKLSVVHGLRQGGTLVVNAGSAPLVAALTRVGETRPDVSIQMFEDTGADGLEVDGGWVPWTEVPLSFGGMARHNVENALAAVLAARAAGLPEGAIVSALRGFVPSAEESSGRMNLVECHGVRMLVDFAHNPEGIRSLGPVVRSLAGVRTLLVIGQAGDRTDALVLTCAEVAAAWNCDAYVVKEIAGYLRGRNVGEVPDLLARGLSGAGIDPARMLRASDDVDAVRVALEWACPGDVLVLLVHERLEEVEAMIAAWSGPA